MKPLELFKNDEEHVDFQAGDIIFSENDRGDFMYVIKKGEVEILAGNLVIDTANAGEIIGEMALIDASERSATARAKTDCSLIPVDQRRFRFLVQQTPFFSIYVMRVLVERLRKSNKTLAHVE